LLYPYNSDKTDAQKLELTTKIDVYSYRRVHRGASCAGLICRGCEVTGNTAVSLLKASWALLNSWNSIQ
jgi:hypothetical protein